MAKTLHESFHEIINNVRRLNAAAIEVVSELNTNSFISEQKLRRLLTINAKTVQIFAIEKTQPGMGAYSKNELGDAFNVGALANSTENAMATFRDTMIGDLPTPDNNGLDINGNSTLLTVSTVAMPNLIDDINTLVIATGWA